jgi:hypothetical protein
MFDSGHLIAVVGSSSNAGPWLMLLRKYFRRSLRIEHLNMNQTITELT